MAAFSWFRSSATNTNITAGTPQGYLAALNTAFVANSADAAASWEVASYSAVSPRYLVLKRKDASPGRIILFGESGSTPHTNAAYQSLASNLVIAYYPAETNDTPSSWIAGAPFASSGIKGLICWPADARTGADVRYYDCAAGIVFENVSTTNNSGAWCIAGELFEDKDANYFSCASGCGPYSWPSSQWYNVNDTSSGNGFSPVHYTNTVDANYSNLIVRHLYATDIDSFVYRAFCMKQTSTYAMANIATYRNYFMPIWFIGNTSAQPAGITGKLRQMAFGPYALKDQLIYELGTSALIGSPVGCPSPSSVTHPLWLLESEI